MRAARGGGAVAARTNLKSHCRAVHLADVGDLRVEGLGIEGLGFWGFGFWGLGYCSLEGFNLWRGLACVLGSLDLGFRVLRLRI